MSFLDRVRDKLLEPGRVRRVERFAGNEMQRVFAGLEIIAENLEELRGMLPLHTVEMTIPELTYAPVRVGVIKDLVDTGEPVLNIPFSDPPIDPPPAPAVGRVNKPCEKCGEMMFNVYPATKKCPTCKGAK